MRVSMPVNFVTRINTIESLCPQYYNALQESHSRKPFSYENQAVLQNYLTYVRAGCFVEASDLYQDVSQIRSAEALIELAEKIDRAASPFVRLCREGRERLELAKENPEERPTLPQRLAMGFNAINLAILQEDKEMVKTVMKNICDCQDLIAKIPPEQLSEQTSQLNALCEARMDAVDPSGVMRDEIRTWTGFLKATAVTVLPFAGALGSIFISPVTWMGMQTLLDYLGEGMARELTQVLVVAIFASNLYNSMQTRNVLGVSANGYFVSRQIYGIYTQAARALPA